MRTQKRGASLVDTERAWFTSRVTKMLEKTRRILHVLQRDDLNDERKFEGLCRSVSVEQVCANLGTTLGGIFRSLVSEEEWNELEVCSRNIAERNEAQIRTERLRRQKNQLEKCAQLVINLTVRDEEVQEEQAKLAAESVDVAQSFLKAAGLTGRLTTLKAIVVRPNDSEEEEDEHEGEDAESIVPGRPKRGRQKEVVERQDEAGPLLREKVPRKKTKVVEEEPPLRRTVEVEEEEESVSMSESDGDDVEGMLEEIGKKVALAAEDAKMLRQLLGSVNLGCNQSLRFRNVAPPDVALATGAEGEVLLREPNLLKGIFEQEDVVRLDSLKFEDANVEHDNDLIEKLGTLLSWWRLVRQALALAGIFAHLKKNGGGRRRRGRGKLMKQRFEEVVKSISYTQAKKYARIGQLVSAFPQLLYQTQFVLVAQWMATLPLADGTSSIALVDLFPKLLNQEQLTFWRISQQLCKTCSVSDRRQTLTCDGCGFQFHALCAGYPGEDSFSARVLLRRPARGRAKVPPVTEFVTMLYCANCLPKNDTNVNVIVKSVSEKQAVADFLNQDGCKFTLERVPGDGYCIFRILEDFAKTRLGMAWSSETFCKKLAEAAVRSLEESRKETGDASLDADSMKAFRKLATETGRVGMLKRGLWRDLETQHVLKGYANLFEGQVRVHTYEASMGRLKETDVYPYGGDDGNLQELYVLHWSASDHYDELVPN